MKLPEVARRHFQAGLAALTEERDQLRQQLDAITLQIEQITEILADDDLGTFRLDLNLTTRSVKEILDEAFPIGSRFRLEEAMKAIKVAGNPAKAESVTSIISRSEDYQRVARGLYQRIKIDSSDTNAPDLAGAFVEPEEKGGPQHHDHDSSLLARSDGDHQDHQ
jgi:hypothetical protein